MRFRFEQHLDVPHARVALFFSDVRNLRKISLPYPRLIVNQSPTKIAGGMVFPLMLDFGLFAMRWDAAIEDVTSGISFTDSFQNALIRSWRHYHSFTPVRNGTLLVDELECDCAWWFSPLLWVGVHSLFLYRRVALRKVLQ